MLHDFCARTEVMSNLESSFREDPEALIDLLEDIVTSYQDNDSRPDDALNLYRQRVQLGASYRVKLAKRFVVVDGGVSHRPSRHHRKSKRSSWTNPTSSLSRKPRSP